MDPFDFSGKNVAITGKFVTMSRSDASALLSAAGANVGGSVTAKTDVLVHGERAGSKLTKARTLGIRILTEAEFVAGLANAEVESELLDGAADKVAEAAAEEEKKMRRVRETIDPVLASQVERWGLPLGQLLLKYIQVFSQRPDVFVFEQKIGGPLDNKGLRYFDGQLPPALLALLTEVNALEWNWMLAEEKAERGQWSKGYKGGRIELRGVRPGYVMWHPIPDWRKEYEDYAEELVFDDFVAEGMTWFSRDKGQTRAQASLIFDNANDCVRHPLGSLEDYLTRGAKAAFTWYWQMGDWEGTGFRGTLLARSVPADTDAATLQSLLEAKGLSAPEAKALMAWLGEDVRVLLHESETPAGLAQGRLAAIFPHSNEATARTGEMDLELIRQLTGSAEPLSLEDWKTLREEHARFLSSGGGGGSWTPLSVSGLPLCMYQGPKAEKGAQAVLRLKKLTRFDASGVDLSWADLSSFRAEGIQFKGAKLSHSIAIDSLLDGCNFDEADLSGVDFSGSSLRGASFRGATLTGADFEACDLTGADFRGAKLEGSRFPGAVLDEVITD